ncbi:hypothetical protein [Xanthobacter autotrophicus]|nr:hypothetical protein [Xanthobacter autotrophicus]
MITVLYVPKGLVAPVTALANRQGGEHLEALSAQDAIAAAAE